MLLALPGELHRLCSLRLPQLLLLLLRCFLSNLWKEDEVVVVDCLGAVVVLMELELLSVQDTLAGEVVEVVEVALELCHVLLPILNLWCLTVSGPQSIIVVWVEN